MLSRPYRARLSVLMKRARGHKDYSGNVIVCRDHEVTPLLTSGIYVLRRRTMPSRRTSMATIINQAHEIGFGSVSAARWNGTEEWRVWDSRLVRQGARCVAEGLTFDEAVAEAWRVAQKLDTSL